MRVRFLSLAKLAVLLAALAPNLAAQGSCEVNNQNVCPVGGDATHAINVTIQHAIRLILASTTVNMPAPTAAQYTAGTGTSQLVPIQVRSNAAWNLSIRGTAATWTGTGPSARLDKPVGDLQWSIDDSNWTDMTTTNVQFTSGAADDGVAPPALPLVYLRVKYSWTLDSTGGYTLPIAIVLTSP